MLRVEENFSRDWKRPSMYPYLGYIGDEKEHKVVLFSHPGSGVIVGNTYKDAWDAVGRYHTGWDETMFKPYAGTVTLSNV